MRQTRKQVKYEECHKRFLKHTVNGICLGMSLVETPEQNVHEQHTLLRGIAPVVHQVAFNDGYDVCLSEVHKILKVVVESVIRIGLNHEIEDERKVNDLIKNVRKRMLERFDNFEANGTLDAAKCIDQMRGVED